MFILREDCKEEPDQRIANQIRLMRSKMTIDELIKSLCLQDNVTKIEIPKSGRVEVAAEDKNKNFKRKLPSGEEYDSHYFYDEFHEGPVTILIIEGRLDYAPVK